MATVDRTTQYRERIWADLRKVGRPDSRFHWDLSSFIADFEGSDICTDRTLDLEVWRTLGNRRVFITPDNSTEELRKRLIAENVPFVMTTYGIQRGFVELDSTTVPPGEESYAATLDGMDRYAVPVSLGQLQAGDPFAVLVTGGTAVSMSGVRFGKGHGYFDFEYAALSELGLVDSDAVLIDMVHDCQVVDEHLDGEPHDVVMDYIVTPTRTIPVHRDGREPGRILWDLIPGTEFERLEVTAELRRLVQTVDKAPRADKTIDAERQDSFRKEEKE
ncbi:hypothetical protein MNBD_ACTINO02-2417 [hydrothermal vent metagenome]|jgi:5-formyltetrahydrofolate cyclo-ligase|uniref:5-formyltetrahydrofolate cyclo-ligase n=1 Tax=hydrothermal vent metagenome TaxID=652676 RepID=A0A3B0SMJ9_9ZZZZ